MENPAQGFRLDTTRSRVLRGAGEVPGPLIESVRRRSAAIASSLALACLIVATIQATPSTAAPVFADGFESGNLAAWSSSANFAVQATSVRTGSWAGRARSNGAVSHAGRTFGAQAEVWSTVWFKVDARTTPVWLTSFRKASGGGILLVGINKNGALIARNNVTKVTYVSTVTVTNGVWHELDVHLRIGSGGRFDVSLDAVPVAALSRSNGLGTSAITQIKIGDTSTGRSFDVSFDDVSVASDPGSSDTTDPSPPTNLAATIEDQLSARLTWDPSNDDTGVVSYTIRRSTDGSSYTAIGSSTTASFLDTGLDPSTPYWWTVEANDAAGNVSDPSVAATATTGSVDPASRVGRWSAPVDVGVVGVHAAVLFTGKVLLFYETGGAVGTMAKLWDPATGGVVDVSVPIGQQHNLFCSGHSLRPNGDVFVTGGTIWGGSIPNGTEQTAFFDPITERWRAGPPMAWRRWYPSDVTLPDGDALVFSGRVTSGALAETVERYDGSTEAFSTLPGSATLAMQLYPRMFVMRDGRIARVGPEAKTIYFDPGTNAWSDGPTMLAGSRPRGSAILLPDGRRVLALGGAVNSVTSATAEIVDLGAGQPSWASTGSMTQPRRNLNAVLLPDGKVLAVGGNRGTANYDDPVLTAELYDPSAGTWTEMAAQAAPRAYHSTAMLLPDGRVLSAGQTNGTMQTTIEVYSPPYLFAGPRPVIGSAPRAVGYTGTFSVETDRAADIAEVVLVRPSTVTHGVNFDQRSVPLAFSAGAGGLEVGAPASSTHAPPGWYMMFLVDDQGVPSVASWVRVA